MSKGLPIKKIFHPCGTLRERLEGRGAGSRGRESGFDGHEIR
ncbi:hypothetical protein [Nostoc sp. PA-18-2419]|nr:hypothetical protein [Nostoc sp. PA-18-2419]